MKRKNDWYIYCLIPNGSACGNGGRINCPRYLWEDTGEKAEKLETKEKRAKLDNRWVNELLD